MTPPETISSNLWRWNKSLQWFSILVATHYFSKNGIVYRRCLPIKKDQSFKQSFSSAATHSISGNKQLISENVNNTPTLGKKTYFSRHFSFPYPVIEQINFDFNIRMKLRKYKHIKQKNIKIKIKVLRFQTYIICKQIVFSYHKPEGVGIKLLKRLRPSLSHLSNLKFKHRLFDTYAINK